MHPTEVVLAVVDAAGTVPGRTSLQKICYFLEQPLEVELGFRPHYYGPFSNPVSEAADNLVMAGLLNDQIERGYRADPGGRTEWQQHNYSLTEDGEEVIGLLEESDKENLETIRGIVGFLNKTEKLKPTALSLAAKYHFIRYREQVNDLEDMPTTARTLGWNLTTDQLGQGKKIADALFS